MSRLRSDTFDLWVKDSAKRTAFEAGYRMLVFHDYQIGLSKMGQLKWCGSQVGR